MFLRNADAYQEGATVNQAFAAIKMGDLKMLQQLLEAELDPNSKNSRGYTLIHMAVLATRPSNEEAMLALLKLLIDCGGNVNRAFVRLDENYTPLHSAVRRKLPAIVELLLTKGADRNIQDKKNKTPIKYANEFQDERGKQIIAILKNHQTMRLPFCILI